MQYKYFTQELYYFRLFYFLSLS
uniref:Uncharacterized protein n=1 Tax=Arundo donax TaxID=35708 RepID=A0A0A8Y6B2_ARUDO